MTEKRFKFDTALDKIYDCDTYNNETHTCESYDNLYDIADLLNSLSKENEQLKNWNKSYQYEIKQLKKCYNKLLEDYDKLAEENEQLKQQVSDDFNQSNCITVQKSIINDLKKENEELQNYKQFVFDLIDKKLKEYPYLTLTEIWNKDCKYYHGCRKNHEKNVAYASRHTLLQELKKELEE